jgi:probable rRNA maturation factor
MTLDSLRCHEERPNGIHVSLVNEQSRHPVDEQQLIAAIESIVKDSEFASAQVSVAIVDDATMHDLNRQYLEHDYPTDVLSFVLEEAGGHLEGEVIISADTAAANAADIGWPAAAEQLLYAIHGTLHLIGYRDKHSDEIAQMRAAEQKYLSPFGLKLPSTANDLSTKYVESDACASQRGAAGP